MKSQINTFLFLLLVIILIVSGGLFLKRLNRQPDAQPSASETSEYNPQIVPSKFTTSITNKYFSLPVGRKLIYHADTENGVERTELEIESETKTILGVETVIYRDKVFLDGELVEDTKDYLAQDDDGNVWYFGEDVRNYENGQFKNNEGSWIAGVDGAKPGIWIKAVHTVGDSYRQEYYKDNALDMRDVVAVEQVVETDVAKYTGCVKMYDWTPLDPNSKENKYYCPEVGALVLIEDLETGEKTTLIETKNP